jgi:hypothetical protein
MLEESVGLFSVFEECHLRQAHHVFCFLPHFVCGVCVLVCECVLRF